MLQAGHRDRKVRKPLAVVFTKLDALWHEFPEGSALKRSEPKGAGCDELDSLDVHRHVQALLHDWDGQQIDRYLHAQLPLLPVFRGLRARRDPDPGPAGLAASSSPTGSATRSCGCCPRRA